MLQSRLENFLEKIKPDRIVGREAFKVTLALLRLLNDRENHAFTKLFASLYLIVISCRGAILKNLYKLWKVYREHFSRWEDGRTSYTSKASYLRLCLTVSHLLL